MRSVFRGGLLGGLPGLLIALGPLVLHEMDVITSDQSQIGFSGVPLLFIGVVVGTLVGASKTDYYGLVMLGVGVGFVVGLASGLLIAAGTGLALIWLFLAPAAMIAGGVLGAWWGEHSDTSHRTAAQH